MKRSNTPERKRSRLVRARVSNALSDPLLDLSGDIDGLPPNLSQAFGRYGGKTLVAKSVAPISGKKRVT